MDVVEAQLAHRYPYGEIRRRPHSNPGHDFEVGARQPVERYIEAKGTVAGCVDFFVSGGEHRLSATHSDRYTIAVVHSLDLVAKTGVFEWFDGEIDGRFKLDPTHCRARFES